MNGFPTMSPIFGVFFALAGLALAVILGLVMYPDKKQLHPSNRFRVMRGARQPEAKT